jgi:hypothetical protein
MTDNGAPQPAYPPRKKLSFERERPVGNVMQQGALLVYGLLTVGLAGLAFYMANVNHMALLSGYVVAPAIGAAWFALRLFMMLNSRKSD